MEQIFINYMLSQIVQQQNIFVKMQNLLENSRRSANQNESPVKLSHLSPQKYGKGAFCDLAYTPSKLADNILYRQVTTLKKVEQGNGKLRETQALNSLFQDRLEQLKEERDGIEKSLTSQITMYKRLLQECENKSQARIKEIQSNFKLEIKKIILEKEQEAKYAQSERQLLQNRIEQLERLLNELQQTHADQVKQHNDLKNQKEKVDIMYRHSMTNLANVESKRQIDAQQAKNKHDELNRQILTNTNQYKKQLQDTISNKNRQIENLERLHRTELEKIENKRAAENLMKNQELKDITNAFEAQGKRLNEIISMKQRMVDTLNKDLNKQKQRVLELTRTYQNEINNLAHEKARFNEEVDALNHQNTTLNLRLNECQNLFEKQKIQLENYIRSLKQDLEINQVNFIREKDRNVFIAGDFQKQLLALKSQNASLRGLSSENEILTREVRNLRELLLESSHEMQKCKEQFIRMGRQRDLLILQLRQVGCENDVLHKIKNEREDEARGWRQSYYISRNRY